MTESTEMMRCIVTSLDDPEGEYRIGVRRHLDADEDGHDDGTTADTEFWARIATPQAGRDAGMFNAISIGEEVLVARTHAGDCYYLGGLWSSHYPSPAYRSTNSPTFAVCKRNGAQIMINASGSLIELKTATGRYVRIDDAAGSIVLGDKHGSQAEIGGNGLSLQSGTGIKLESQTEMELETASVVKIKGAVVIIDGQVLVNGQPLGQ